MNIDKPKLIKQLESLVDNRQDWLFRFAYIRIGQREDAEDIVQEVLLRNCTSIPSVTLQTVAI